MRAYYTACTRVPVRQLGLPLEHVRKQANSRLLSSSHSKNNVNTVDALDPDLEESTHTRDLVLALFQSLSITQFSLQTHAPTITSKESALIRNLDMSSGAKAMVLTDMKGFSMVAVLSASRNIDLKALRKLLKKKLKLASPEHVWELTQCRVGGVPPFGSVWGVQTYCDVSLKEQGVSINFNLGLRRVSCLGLSFQDYLRAENPVLANFSVEKK